MFKGFVRFGRIDILHNPNMLSYLPYSFQLYPAIYSMHRGTSEIYSLNMSDLLGSLKKFVADQIKVDVNEITDSDYDMDSLSRSGRLTLLVPT
jgi:hypothetical protein